MRKTTSSFIASLVLLVFAAQTFFAPLAPFWKFAPVAKAQEPISEIQSTPEAGEQIELQPEPQSPQNSGPRLHYTRLMDRYRDMQPGRAARINPMLIANEVARFETERYQLKADIETFIEQEQTRLNALGVSAEKQERYFERLRFQREHIEDRFMDKFIGAPDNAPDSTSNETETTPTPEAAPAPQAEPEVTIGDIPAKALAEPSEFKSEQPAAPVRSFNIQSVEELTTSSSQPSPPISFQNWLQKAHAAIPYNDLPLLADLLSTPETQINTQISELATSLNNNPVEIYNYVRNHVIYEPYFGAKKGALGCLHESYCNDTDAASLTIALLRASNIPARYKKGYAMMPVEQLQNLLGVEETKTVYAAFTLNNVPVYTIAGNSPAQGDLDDFDFSDETHLVVEWTFVEAFYEYDERGANFSNDVIFPAEAIGPTSSDDTIRAILEQHPQKEWVRMDAVIKPYTHTKNEIVHQTANFNTQNFWQAYLEDNIAESPLDTYATILKDDTDKDINHPDYQSTHQGEQKNFGILPSAPPYVLVTGTVGATILTTEKWTQLPDARRSKVIVRVKKNIDDSLILEHEFFGNEINNIPFSLNYQGATETDIATIESYGGIHVTPADLVDIVPAFSMDYDAFSGETPITIGTPLVLEFEYFVNNQSIHKDQKLSVAGNTEGIYIALSHLNKNTHLDDPADPDQNSKILLEGNAELARQYLRRLEQNTETLEKAMDRSYNPNFIRAVVTQNRILTPMDDVPTTFDFSGLTMDASAYIINYSNRGNYKNLSKDFHLLWGLQASYNESDIFEDITGLESISTVKGIQFAYEMDDDYTMHTINAANEADIDALELSAATKAKMHTDAQAGRTIITPNKPVTKGIFTGPLYISLAPDGTGLYAIGQQNGAHQTNETEKLFASLDEIEAYYLADTIGAASKYTYAEGPWGVQCNLLKTTIDEIKATANANIPAGQKWKSEYGAPCYKPKNPHKFGDLTHTYIVATSGIKFFGDGGGYNYNYWVRTSKIQEIFERDKNGEDHETIHSVKWKKDKLRFNLPAGTFSQPGTLSGLSEEWFFQVCKECVTIYYEPGLGIGRMVYGMILTRIHEPTSFPTLSKLGYPTGNRDFAKLANEAIGGTYQNFVNGQVYLQNSPFLLWTNITYTYGKITALHNQKSGTRGELGFPISDPQKAPTGHTYQVFENDKEIEVDPNNVPKIVATRKYRCEVTGWKQYTKYELDLIVIHGIIDTGVNTVVGAFGVAEGIYTKIQNIKKNPLKEAADFIALVGAIANTDLGKLKDSIQAGVSATIDALKEELKEAFCPARQSYLSGIIVGEVLLIAIPSTKIVAAAKLKLLQKGLTAFPKLSKLATLGNWGRKMRVQGSDYNLWQDAINAPSLQKGEAGEAFWQAFTGTEKPSGFSTPFGQRIPDAYDPITGNAYEVKNFGSRNVRYTDSNIADEIEKEIHLMNSSDVNYRPVWVFLDQGPNGDLQEKLEKLSIEFIIIEP